MQGIGAALFEECVYSPEGQLLNGSLADYLVPMAGELPDIEVGHTCTPTATSELGAKGAGEAGTAGAPAAIMNAINDALKPLARACWNCPSCRSGVPVGHPQLHRLLPTCEVRGHGGLLGAFSCG